MGWYCHAYKFMNIPFLSAAKPDVPLPTKSPVPASPADISLELTCAYTHNGMTYNCEDAGFAQLQRLTTCEIPVVYTYTILNRSDEPVKLSALLSNSFVNLAKGEVLQPYSKIVISKDESIDACNLGGTTMEKTAYVVGSPTSGGIAATDMDSISIDVP